MKARITRETLAVLDANDVFITAEMHAIIGQVDKSQWESLFNQFRRSLQSRIVGINTDVDLHKLQGKIELTEELQRFFEKIVSTPAKTFS